MKGFVLIYAVFHPTIKIMDDDIDLAGAVAMTGPVGRKENLAHYHSQTQGGSRSLGICVDKCGSICECARVLDHPLY